MSTSEFKSLREGASFIVSHPAHIISLGFGMGLVSIAPGTFGTILAIPVYLLIADLFRSTAVILVLILMFAVGIWVCNVSGTSLRSHDSKIIVWDEVVGFCVVLFFTPPGIWWLLTAFILFRIFDIFKPYPINLIDQNLCNGLGVMLDDLVASFYTLLCLAFFKSILIPLWKII